jgi:hypothetical protein
MKNKKTIETSLDKLKTLVSEMTNEHEFIIFVALPDGSASFLGEGSLRTHVMSSIAIQQRIEESIAMKKKERL